MPILHSQITAQSKTPDAKTDDVHPAIALQARGPVIQVTVSIEQNAGQALVSQGKTLPTPKAGLALIEKVPCNVYPVLISTPIAGLNSPRTMGAALAAQGLLVLIGRDVLQNCTLFYNGVAGQFTLSL